MANTYVDYTATSGQTDFAFTFPYLKDTHVIVSIDGTETDVNDTGSGSFTIVTSPSSTLVRLDSGATAGANVRVKRNSLGKGNLDTTAIVDYNDGSVLTEKDLDDAYLHNFYLSQEAVENADSGLGMDSTVNRWDADNKKIINVADPTDTNDAANKAYVDGRLVAIGAGTVSSITAGNGLSGGTITTSGTVSIPTSGGDLNINSGKVGIGGDADGTYKAKVTGDLLVSESGDHTVLTVENTNTSGANNSTLLITAPQNATIQLKDTDTTSANTGIYNITSANGFFNVGHISDDGLTGTPLLSLHPTGNVKIDQLPTTDPSTAGYLWNNGGVVSVSGSSGFSGGVSKYDSGWVTTDGSTTVANGATLTFTHGLSTSALNAQIWVSGASDGSYPYLMDIQETFTNTSMVGAGITNITSTQITIQFADSGYVYMNSSGQNATSTVNGHDAASSGYVPFTSKYVRVVAIG
jgi:hypothetical protein